MWKEWKLSRSCSVRSYRRKIPWYGRYLFTRNDEEGGYRVICMAADNLLDPPPADGYQGQTTSFNDDIVMVNGQFVQWPEGSQQ